ncbi:MAG: hypothetical protein KBD78_14835 [Oligoflexales bacterium]|nr:hypothetical protein [Oligoflexales bacterium]
MEMKKIKIKNYVHTDLLGSVISDVEIYVDSNVDPATFNQKNADFGLDEDEINKLTDLIVFNFLKDNFRAIQHKKRKLSGDEVRGIITYLKLNNTQFGNLIGYDKGTISRIVRDIEPISVQASISTLMFLWEEYCSSGFCKRTLGLEKPQRREDKRLPWLSDSAA